MARFGVGEWIGVALGNAGPEHVPKRVDVAIHDLIFEQRSLAALGAILRVPMWIEPFDSDLPKIRSERRNPHGKLLLRNRHLAARRAEDDRDGGAPGALARDREILLTIGD